MEELRCLLDIPSLRVFYDVTNKWLYAQWLGEHDEASMRFHSLYVRACLAAQPCTKILSDHSLLQSTWQNAPDWAGQLLLERLSEQGIRYFAWVYSPGYHDRLAMEKAMARIRCPSVAIFDELASAYDWLRRYS